MITTTKTSHCQSPYVKSVLCNSESNNLFSDFPSAKSLGYQTQEQAYENVIFLQPDLHLSRDSLGSSSTVCEDELPQLDDNGFAPWTPGQSMSFDQGVADSSKMLYRDGRSYIDFDNVLNSTTSSDWAHVSTATCYSSLPVWQQPPCVPITIIGAINDETTSGWQYDTNGSWGDDPETPRLTMSPDDMLNLDGRSRILDEEPACIQLPSSNNCDLEQTFFADTGAVHYPVVQTSHTNERENIRPRRTSKRQATSMAKRATITDSPQEVEVTLDGVTHDSNTGRLVGTRKSDARPLVCGRIVNGKRCERRFRRAEHFNRHRNGHDGLRVHACLMCKGKFSRSDNFRDHVKTHLDIPGKRARNETHSLEEIQTLFRNAGRSDPVLDRKLRLFQAESERRRRDIERKKTEAEVRRIIAIESK